jgi:hypothetical protein
MKKFLVLSDAQREALRFHLDAARATPFDSTRHQLHVYMARSIAGLVEEEKPTRTRKTRSASNHPNLAEHRNGLRRAA